MNLNSLLKNYIINRDRGKHTKKVGRYWASSLFEIITNRLKPEDYFKKKVLDLKACRNISEGIMREDKFNEILKFNKVAYDWQPKEVMKIDGMELVVVSDFEFDDMMLECKAPNIMPDRIRTYHYPQLESQFRAFNKPVYIIYLKERWQHKFFKYKPNDSFWEEIVKRLKKFHEALRNYEEQKQK